MAQFVKVVSLAVVFGMSLLPAKAHPPAVNPPATAVVESMISVSNPAPATPRAHLEEVTQKAYDAMVARAEAEAAAAAAKAEAEAKAQADAQAKAAADAKAAAAALAAARVVKVVAPNAPAVPAPAPAASGSVPDMIRAAFGPQGPAAVDWGLRIAKCESGYNPRAYNPSGASGVFQFMPGTFRGTPYGGGDIFDAATNVNAAAWYYQNHGGGAWVCS